MPAAVAIPLITAAASGTAAIVGSKLSSNAAKRAADVTSAANKEATDLARETEAERRKEFEAQQAELKRQFDVNEANRLETEARKEPYRAASRGALMSLGDLFGIPIAASGGAFGASGASGPAPNLPQRPSDLAAAIQQANQIAYGGTPKHSDPNYWAGDWAKDPDYTWRRLLGEGAGGSDKATSGPYADAVAQATVAAMPKVVATASANPIQQPGVIPMANLFRAPYQPRVPMGV